MAQGFLAGVSTGRDQAAFRWQRCKAHPDLSFKKNGEKFTVNSHKMPRLFGLAAPMKMRIMAAADGCRLLQHATTSSHRYVALKV